MKFITFSVLPLATAFALPSLPSFLAPRQTCLPSQYCVLVCNAPHFAGTCNTVCGPNGECRLIQNGLNNNVFSARTTCGAGVYLWASFIFVFYFRVVLIVKQVMITGFAIIMQRGCGLIGRGLMTWPACVHTMVFEIRDAWGRVSFFVVRFHRVDVIIAISNFRTWFGVEFILERAAGCQLKMELILVQDLGERNISSNVIQPNSQVRSFTQLS